jgi:hypothetical protein
MWHKARKGNAMLDVIAIVDHVEDAEKDGKKYIKLTDKDGNTYGIGSWLEKKWNILQSGTAVKLFMATAANGRDYVKDMERCQDIMEAKKIMQQQQQRPKSTIDISIEAQVAVKCVSDMMVSGVITVPEDLKEMAFEWIRNSIKAAI